MYYNSGCNIPVYISLDNSRITSGIYFIGTPKKIVYLITWASVWESIYKEN